MCWLVVLVREQDQQPAHEQSTKEARSVAMEPSGGESVPGTSGFVSRLQLEDDFAEHQRFSASTASRFMSCEHAPDAVVWQELNHWQLKRLYGVPRRGRRGDVVLKLDLTCVEKTGRRIPFARLFNRSYGIQLVVLHVCFSGLSFPLAYRIYQGKGKETPVDLALELLEAFPASAWAARTVVLADAGFGSRDFIQGCQHLGFTRLLVGMRYDRNISDGSRLAEIKRRGERVVLHDLPGQPLYVGWCDVKREKGKKETARLCWGRVRYALLSTLHKHQNP